KGPRSGVLALWDEMTSVRPIVGIAGLDAHAQRLVGLTAFPYEFLFRTLRTHVLCCPPTGNSADDVAAVLDSIRLGHVYFSNDLYWSPKGFAFSASVGGKDYLQGDVITDSGKIRLSVSLPDDAAIRVLRDGELWTCMEGRSWEDETSQHGVYRVEVSRESQPWIFSNPIYFRNIPFI
ncbi:MAG TPA: hypothetical protein PKH07_13285, partial [bacterium]|nr:hypothetical protein [bacterium]